MQFKVPQNIDMADKIIGPLTLLQFVYLMAGGIIIYVSFETVKTGVFWVIAVPTAILSLLLAFVKIQDQPFANFLGWLVLYVSKPRRRIWQKKTELEVASVIQVKQEANKKEKKVYKNKTMSEVNLEELSYVLDTRGLGQTAKEKKSTTPIVKGETSAQAAK